MKPENPDHPAFTEQDFREFVLGSRWKFAKTMPHMPHWYTLREWHLDETFEAAVRFIRREGYRRKFGRTTYIYFDVGDHKFWTMGAPASETILINRAEIDS